MRTLAAIFLLSSLSFAQGGGGKVGFGGKAGFGGGASGGGVAAITRVSATTCAGNFVNSFTCALTSPLSVGQRGIVIVYSNTSMATLTPAISDPSSNAWSSCIQANNTSNANGTLAVCDAVITSSVASGLNITISIPGSAGASGAGAIVYAASSGTGTSGADTSNTGTAFSTTASITTAGSLSATDFVFGGFIVVSGATFAIGGTYTTLDCNLALQNSYTFTFCGEWKSQTSGATATADGTLTASGWNGIVAAYKK